MNKSATLSGIVCCFILMFSGIKEASSDTRYFSGTSCVGNSSGDNYYAHRTNEGCSNGYSVGYPSCSSPLLLLWPIVGFSNDTEQWTQVDVRYHKTTSGTLQCYANVTNASGTQYTGTAATVSTTGYGDLTLTGTQLPNGNTNVANMRVAHVFCYVPGSVWTVDVGCTGNTEILSVKLTTGGTF